MITLTRSTIASRRRRAVLGLAPVAVLALVAAPAQASIATTFATGGPGAGQVDDASSVAVDQADGTVYIGDRNNFRIDEFDEHGTFVRAFGFGVRTGADELQVCTVATTCQAGLLGDAAGEIKPGGVVVDPSSHDVYVSDEFQYRVEEFTPSGEFILAFGAEVDKTTHADVCTAASHDVCGAGVVGTGPSAFSFAGSLGAGGVDFPYMPLALDAAGHIWVGDVSRLEEFSAAGVFLGEVKLPGAGQIVALALDAAGAFYTCSGRFSREHEGALPGVRKYDAAGHPLNFTSRAANTLVEPGQPLSLTYDGSGHLFVGDATGELPFHEDYRLLEFDAVTGAEVESFGTDEVIGFPGPGKQGDEGEALAFGAHGTPRIYAASSQPSALTTEGFDLSVAQLFTLPPAGPLLRVGSPFAQPVGGTTATLRAFLDPEGAETKYHFEYVDQASFETEGGFASPHVKSTPAGSALPSFQEPEASAAIAGLTGETTYRLRLLGENTNGVGNTAKTETSFTTQAPVLLDSVFSTEVSPSSATLNAQIDPLGAESAYRFEYLTDAAYQHNLQAGLDPFAGATVVPSPDGPLGSGETDVSVSQHLQGLQPGTAYRYRAAAHNVGGERFSAAQTLVTQSTGAFPLPDGRSWELVSPAEKQGALFLGIGEGGLIQAAPDGRGIAYLASTPTELGSQGYFSDVQVLSERGAQGWDSRDISLPHEGPPGAPVGLGQEYRSFSEDLSSGLVQPFGGFVQSLSPQASEQTPYLRSDYLHGNPSDPCLPASTACYQPLLVGCPAAPAECRPIVEEHADVPAGTVFGVSRETLEECSSLICGPVFRGATPDLAHVVIESPAIGLTATEGDHGGLYEWAGGALSLVSILPNEKPAASSVPAAPKLGVDRTNSITPRHAISDDGSRVIWSYNGHLYERDIARGVTLQLDKVRGGTGQSPPGDPGAVFQDASSDGRIVYFTAEQRLTAGSGGSENSPDLYECEVVEEAGEQACKLSDLTPGADVQGTVPGASGDGSYVYFVADGALVAGATQGTCANKQRFEPGKVCNLYMRHAGTTTLVAMLSGEDVPDWGGSGGLGGLTARVSPDGRWLAFMSQRSLTGYDNHDVRSARLDEEVFLYDAAGERGAGGLVCASCDPSGARPSGVEYGGLRGLPTLTGGDRVWDNTSWLAANIPGWTPYESKHALYQSRYLSDSGRLFFDSHDALVAQDTNGTQDVYQWEPAGAGDCTTASGAYLQSSGGCVGLISSGTSPVESAFLDASEDGSDVFFLTAARLAGQDIDSSYDVYDAHVCSVSSPCPPALAAASAPCDGDACQGIQRAPEDPTPGSLTFSGAGNLLGPISSPGVITKRPVPLTRAQKLAKALRVCRFKRAKHSRVVCEALARKRFGAKTRGRRAAVKRRVNR